MAIVTPTARSCSASSRLVMGAADPKGCAREGCASLRPRLWDNGGISLPALRAGTATANTISSMFEVRADPLLFFFLCGTRKRRVNKVSVSEGLSVPEKKERRRRRKNLAHRISNRVTASRSAEIAQIMKFSTTPESEVHRPPRCIQTFAIFCSQDLRGADEPTASSNTYRYRNTSK